MTTLYVNTITGTIDEVDGDSFLVNLDVLSTDSAEHAEELDAEDLVEYLSANHS